MYKVGDRVKLKKDINPSYNIRNMVIIEIEDDKYLLSKQPKYGGIWLTRKNFE